MSDKTVTGRGVEPTGVSELSVFANPTQQNDVSLLGGLVRLQYWESILQDTVRATVVYADTGNTIDKKSAVDGLPIVGQEKVALAFEDHQGNELIFKDDTALYVNKVTPFDSDSTKSMVHLDLVSKEFIMNEKVRLNIRFDGKIANGSGAEGNASANSDTGGHIEKILKTDKKYLATKKNIDIDKTANNYNFIGNNRKPFYILNWLSRFGIPEGQGEDGKYKDNTAGFFFWETSEGFKFKSIDNLLDKTKNPQKKSIIFNQSVEIDSIPKGYDVKALKYDLDNRVDVQTKYKMGAYSSRIVMFDPFNCFYEVVTPNAGVTETEGESSAAAENQPANKKNLTTAGSRFPLLNKEFDREGKNQDYTRTTYMLLDTGTLPTGDTEEQLDKSKDINFEAKSVLNQSIMRYNQLFSQKTSVTIPGDFSLHAGDSVFVDAPQLETDTSNDDVNQESGGLYIIADLCHLVTPKETYTKLNLIRDSFGRKGNHTTGR